MRVLYRRSCLIAVLSFALASAVGAQESAAVRSTEHGVTVDFQDTDIRTVITSLAEIAGLNVSFAELPPRRVTLRLRQPIPKSGIAAMLKSLASSYDVAVDDDGGILRFSAAPRDLRPPSARENASGEERLLIYRLRHARAAVLAPTLERLFGGRRGTLAAAPTIGGASLSQRLKDQQMPPIQVDPSPRPGNALASAADGASATLSGQLRGDIQVMADEATNSLFVRAQPSDWGVIRSAIEAMDLRPLQVLIEVVIAEVTQTGDLEFGISGNATSATASGPISGQLLNSATSDFVAQFTRAAGGFSMTVAMNALASRGRVRILSRPIVLAQNNKEARILVGTQRPFIQVSQSVPTNVSVLQQVVQYRDVGTSLTILPTINLDGYVNLQVSQEASTATAETQFGAPVISTREASTQVFIRDGQTAVLGGLVSREQDRSRTGIPILSAIPGLGALFGSTSYRTTTSELFLFLTPHVIANDDDLEQVREDLKKGSAEATGLDRPVSAPLVKPRVPGMKTDIEPQSRDARMPAADSSVKKAVKPS